jgi:hypothetical protein
MQPIEPGDKVVVKRTNDRGTVERTDEHHAIVELETQNGQEVTADFEELGRIHEGAKSNHPA